MKLLDVNFLVHKCYKIPLVRKFASQICRLLGCYIPFSVKVGKGVIFCHNATGTVVHGKTEIGNYSMIFPGVTIGKADVLEDWRHSKVAGFKIGEHAVLCSGCKILCKEGTIKIGNYAIIAANAVVTHDVNDCEIWGGYQQSLLG